MKDICSFQSFTDLDIRVGTIVSADFFKEAIKPAYILMIDFGNEGIKKSSAQITDRYTIAELIGKQIIAIINFPKKQIGPIQSECLVLGVNQSSGIVLLSPDIPVDKGVEIA